MDWIIVERKEGNVYSFLIADSSALTYLPDEAAPGSSAYTADLSYIAVKDLDGDWKQIGA